MAHQKRQTFWPTKRSYAGDEVSTLTKSSSLQPLLLPEWSRTHNLESDASSFVDSKDTGPKCKNYGSVRTDYREFMTIDFGGSMGPVTYAQGKSLPHNLVMIRKTTEKLASRKELEDLLRANHPNWVECLQIYVIPGGCYQVLEMMEATLSDMMSCPLSFEDAEAATICTAVSLSIHSCHSYRSVGGDSAG